MAGVTTGSISRTLLSLSPLAIGAAAGDTYQAGELTPDGRAWDRVTSGSPWVHGRVLRAARMRPAALVGEITVVSSLAAGPATHETALSDLIEALSQFTYTMTLTVTDGANNQSWTYACEPADCNPSESINRYGRDRFTTVQVTIPHYPIPSAGAW
jgi:hypothetical protein